jgi:hypothetical protein
MWISQTIYSMQAAPMFDARLRRVETFSSTADAKPLVIKIIHAYHNWLLHFLHELHAVKNFPFRRFLHFPRQHEFIENAVYLVVIEYDVEFTNVGKVRVQ